jgi:hypothetical protein
MTRPASPSDEVKFGAIVVIEVEETGAISMLSTQVLNAMELNSMPTSKSYNGRDVSEASRLSKENIH